MLPFADQAIRPLNQEYKARTLNEHFADGIERPCGAAGGILLELGQDEQL